MNKYEYRKIEYFLYNYKDTDRIIKQIENNFINRTNITLNSWIKDKNTLENQVIKIIDNKNILELKKWQVLNKEVLAFFMKKYPEYYNFLKLKYLEKRSKEEIKESLKIDFKEQKKLKDKLIELIYINANKRNLA